MVQIKEIKEVEKRLLPKCEFTGRSTERKRGMNIPKVLMKYWKNKITPCKHCMIDRMKLD
jgi:hypothetical protein